MPIAVDSTCFFLFNHAGEAILRQGRGQREASHTAKGHRAAIPLYTGNVEFELG